MILSKSIATPKLHNKKIIIGIDPGLARTGIGVIERNATQNIYIDHQIIRTSTDDTLANRLAKIFTAVQSACATYRPQQAAIERTFINMNLASSHVLGQARGAALAALGASGLPVFEVAPNTVKRSVTGDRLASKAKVARMIYSMLNIPKSTKLPMDASDALAIAVSSTTRPTHHKFRRLSKTRRRRRKTS